ncbi:MAG: nuclease-related domain-containing protein [Oscillospiraceae bacterium]
MLFDNNNPDVKMFSYMMIAFFVLVAIGYVVYFLNEKKQYETGVLGKKRLDKMLRGYAKVRNFKVLSDVTITDGKSTMVADHILVGFFGVIIMSNLQGFGEYFGGNSLEQWSFLEKRSSNEKKETKPKVYLENPLFNLSKTEELVKRKLAAQKIYNIPLETFVVFSAPDGRVTYNGEKNPKLVAFSFFKKLLKNSQYEKDNNVDVVAITELLAK